jgi:two-component system LytT family sensor kinase
LTLNRILFTINPHLQIIKTEGAHLPDFYRESMKLFKHIKRPKFYAWASLLYLAMALLHSGTTYTTDLAGRLINETWISVGNIVLVYVFIEYIFTNIRFSFSRILILILKSWFWFFVFSAMLVAWRYIGIGMGVYTPFLKTSSVYIQASRLMGSLLYFGIAGHIYSHIRLRRSEQQLRIEKQEAELNYLKSQTNPHFLFNTLNNIYSLTRDKSDLAPESILRLSKILRYMLYETGGAYIAIEQELKIMNDYIALEQLRYDDSLRVNFNYDVEDMKQALPPLLLIPLVENAFKHGVSETRNRPFVDIHLSVRNRQLHFSVKNSSERQAEEGNVKDNIGLSNLRRQLELLYKDYKLTVQQEESVFTAVLQINLASHV